MKRGWVLVLALVGVLAAITAWFSAMGWLSLAHLQSLRVDAQALFEQRPVAVVAAFFALYVVVAALSVPGGATALTLLAGALFGWVWGSVVVSFASSIGATLAMLASRTVLRRHVIQRLGARAKAIDEGVAKDGATFLFMARLTPLVPFALVNLAMGLTAMPARTFYAVSQVGMLPGTLVYVNAGTQLASLKSLSGIVSAPLLGAFILLGLFPWAMKKAVDVWQARRWVAPFAALKPRRFDCNLLVIGAGSAGLVASNIAAALKAKVVLVEQAHMGGDCLNTGCVPSKALIKSAAVAHQARHSAGYGVHTGDVRVDFAAVMQRVRQAVRSVEPHDSPERYRSLGVDVRQGQAKLLDPWRVQITSAQGSQETLSARNIVIATGAQPWVPPLPGLQDLHVLTSESLWELNELPARLVVLGGGAIGCELAQAFARLGSDVVLVEQAPRLLMREDAELGANVAAVLQADGVRVLTGHRALRGDGPAGALVVQPSLPAQQAQAERSAQGPAAERALPCSHVLVAVGRKPRLHGFGLEALGLLEEAAQPGAPAKANLPVNEALQTRMPHIYACGDVLGTSQPMLTHAAGHQAWHASVNALLRPFWRFKLSNAALPTCLFTEPEVARVGLNEIDAKAQGLVYEVTHYELANLDRALAEQPLMRQQGDAQAAWPSPGFIKVLTAAGSARVLGAAVVAARAGEMVVPWTLALRQGLNLNQLLATIHAYPSWGEANKLAAGQWKRTHAPQSLLRWVARWQAWRL